MARRLYSALYDRPIKRRFSLALCAFTPDRMTIERLTLYRLKLPLATPYKLALGAVHAFDTILVEARDSEGRVGYGEATILTGYTDETVEGSWRFARDLAFRIAGTTPEAAKATIDAEYHAAPFAATALTTAIEMMEGHPLLAVAERTRVPLLAIVNAMDEAGIAREIEARLGEGYKTLKVKVGFDLEPDMARVRFIQKFVRGRAQIRLDGNQGYTRDEAVRFASSLAPDGIELLEQPCPAGDWEAAVAAARVAAVPMMLDESIYGMDDIERAAETKAAAYIKLKLMKAGSLDRLAEGLKRIRALGMTPVLGNGVASDVGCWMEGCVARVYIANAGEMNGFLKPVSHLFRNPIAVKEGGMVLEKGPMPSLNEHAIAAATEETASFPAA